MDAKLAKAPYSKSDLQRLQELLIGDDPPEVAREALRLVKALGKAPEFASDLEARAAHDGIPESQRARIQSVLQLLRSGEAEEPPQP